MTWTSSITRFREPQGALRMTHFLQILDRFPPGRLLDLGAGHGMFAQLAADAGWEATAVDARDERFPQDSRVTWLKQDIREVDTSGFDLVCALGLWYHLTLDDQLGLARKCSGVPLMIDTHIAMVDDKSHHKHTKRLTRIKSDQGYEGRLYFEGDLQDRFTASFKNENSFWPTEDSLRRELKSAGYDVVETFDPPIAPDRRYFLATKIGDDRGKRLDELINKYIPITS